MSQLKCQYFHLLSPQTEQRIRLELQNLLDAPNLKGKFCLNTQNLPYQLEITFDIHQINGNMTEKDSKVRILFGDKYPSEPPTIFFYSGELLEDKCIIKYENWEETTTLKQITQSVMKLMEGEKVEQKARDLYPTTQLSLEKKFESREKNSSTQNLFSQCFSQNSPFKFVKQTIPLFPSIQTDEVSFKEENQLIKVESIQDKLKEKNQKKIKKPTKPMSKNANLPKFLIRMFLKYLEKFENFYDERQYEKLTKQCFQVKQWKRIDKKQHAFGLKHLKQFFENSKKEGKQNRKVIRLILKRFLVEEICQNSQIPRNHQVGYLKACKVYSLRCKNSTLAGRIQSK